MDTKITEMTEFITSCAVVAESRERSRKLEMVRDYILTAESQIADLRAEVGSLKAANGELQRDGEDRDERIDSQYASLAANEATIAELRKELEGRR